MNFRIFMNVKMLQRPKPVYYLGAAETKRKSRDAKIVIFSLFSPRRTRSRCPDYRKVILTNQKTETYCFDESKDSELFRNQSEMRKMNDRN